MAVKTLIGADIGLYSQKELVVAYVHYSKLLVDLYPDSPLLPLDSDRAVDR